MSQGTTAPRRPPAAPRPGPPAGRPAIAAVVLFATAPLEGERPLASQPWEDTTLAARLAGQMRSLGAGRVHVVVRPGGGALLAPSLSAVGAEVDLRESPDLAGDLRLVADVAREASGAVAVAYADIVTQREALAGVLADPRIATGVLVSRRGLKGTRVRMERDRIVSAASPFHRVNNPNTMALGVIKVADGDRPALAEVAEELADLLDGPLPEAWQTRLAARTAPRPTAADPVKSRRRADALRQDVVALLMLGLVRSGVIVMSSKLRRLFWARPLDDAALERATVRIRDFDEDAALLESSVKQQDGFFTTFFVSPYSKYIARWAAHRGWTPNAVTVLSMVVGTAAAVAFATGERAGLIAGAVLLQAAFTLDCVDGQLARYTRTFTSLGAWLDSVFDRAKEYVVFAGLAIGAAATGDGVWLLAGAALALQTARHMLDFSIATARHKARSMAVARLPLDQVSDYVTRSGPDTEADDEDDDEEDAPPAPVTRAERADEPEDAERLRALWKWAKRIAGFPIGERFAAVSITAAIWDAQVTFVVLLVWGVLGMAYVVGGRVVGR